MVELELNFDQCSEPFESVRSQPLEDIASMSGIIEDSSRSALKRFAADEQCHREPVPDQFFPPAAVRTRKDPVALAKVVDRNSPTARERQQHGPARSLAIGVLDQFPFNPRVANLDDKQEVADDSQDENRDSDQCDSHSTSRAFGGAAYRVANSTAPVTVATT